MLFPVQNRTTPETSETLKKRTSKLGTKTASVWGPVWEFHQPEPWMQMWRQQRRGTSVYLEDSAGRVGPYQCLRGRG